MGRAQYECHTPHVTTIQSFIGLFSRTTWVSRYQKGKTNLDFTGARDSEWQWHQLGHMQICTSLQTDTTPVPHHSVFTGRMPFLPPNQQRQSTEGTCICTAIGNTPGFKQYKFLTSADMTGGWMANGRRLASTSIAEKTHANRGYQHKYMTVDAQPKLTCSQLHCLHLSCLQLVSKLCSDYNIGITKSCTMALCIVPA